MVRPLRREYRCHITNRGNDKKSVQYLKMIKEDHR